MTLRPDAYQGRNYMSGYPKIPGTDNQFKDMRTAISPNVRGKTDSKIPISKLPPMNGFLNSETYVNAKIIPNKGVKIENSSKKFDNANVYQKKIEENEKLLRSSNRGKQILKIETNSEPKNYSTMAFKDLQINSVVGTQATQSLHSSGINNKPNGGNNPFGIGIQTTKANYRIRGMSPKKFINMKYPPHSTEVNQS